MRINKVIIHNFRSIRHLEIECLPMVVFIGPNNHGKSNVLLALDFFFSTSNKPVEQDYFVYRDEKEDDLWVEIIFSDLTKQEENTFKKYILSDGSICIRKTSRLLNNEASVIYNGYLDQPKEDWLRIDRAGEYATREKVDQTPLKGFVPQSGRLTKSNVEEAQQKYIQQHISELIFLRSLEEGPLLGTKNVGGGVLPEFYLVPAIRDLSDDIKVRTTTVFGRLLNRAVREMAEKDERFSEVNENLTAIINSLNVRDMEEGRDNQLATLEKIIEDELDLWGVKVSIDVLPPELEKLFELGTDIQLDDGVKTSANRKGHGLQRAMIFALLRAWAKTLQDEKQRGSEIEVAPRKHSSSVIFAIEEPELFLHPHAQRKLVKALREISETSEHQVFVCTHSTYFVNLDHYREIVIIDKSNPERGSCVRQCCDDLFEGNNIEERKKRFHMARWINPDRGELFFARRVVFVEGETEKVVLPYLAERLNIFHSDVSVIDCGSKHNLPMYIYLAKAFGIPYIVIHDEDPLPDNLPDDWDENKIREKRRTFELNKEISDLSEAPLGRVEMMSPDFEGAGGVSNNQGKKKGKALAALDHFDAVSENDIPDRLRQVISAAYMMEDL